MYVKLVVLKVSCILTTLDSLYWHFVEGLSVFVCFGVFLKLVGQFICYSIRYCVFAYFISSLWVQWRSQEGARGAIAPKLPSCPPNKFIWKKILTSFVTNVSPECYNWGYKPKLFLIASLTALFSTPIFIVQALSVIAMVSWVRWPVTIAP